MRRCRRFDRFDTCISFSNFKRGFFWEHPWKEYGKESAASLNTNWIIWCEKIHGKEFLQGASKQTESFDVKKNWRFTGWFQEQLAIWEGSHHKNSNYFDNFIKFKVNLDISNLILFKQKHSFENITKFMFIRWIKITLFCLNWPFY